MAVTSTAMTRRGYRFNIACGCLPPLRQRLQLAADRNLRRRLVLGDDELELVVHALPLAGHQRSLGDVLHRLAGPLHGPDDRAVVGGDYRVEDRLRLEAFGALEHIDRDL